MPDVIESTQLEKYKATLNVALVKENYSEISRQAALIEVRDDNLPEVKKVLDGLEKMVKVVTEKHKAGKASAWQQCQDWDSAKRDLFDLIGGIGKPLRERYNAKCREVEKRQFQQEQDKKRKDQILLGIESNMIAFSQKIASAQSSVELMTIENQINAHATSKQKYEEFLPEAAEKFKSLSSLVVEQRKKLEALEKLEAKKPTDEHTQLVNEEKAQDLRQSIEENAIKIQETVVNETINRAPEYAEEVIPNVKSRRSVWKYEMCDIKHTFDTHPEFISMVPNHEAIAKFLKEKKEQGIDGEKFTVGGINFYLEKTY